MDTQQNIIIAFTDKSDQILSEIMTKYNLEEPLDKMTQNILNDKLNNIVILDKLIKSFAKGEISEKALSDSIQKETGVVAQTADNITKEIVSTLVPTLKILSEADVEKLNKEYTAEAKQIENSSNESLLPKIKAPIGIEEILAKPQTQKTQISSAINEEPLTKIEKAKEKLKKGKVGQESEKPTIKKSLKPDTYREPIA